MKKENKVSTSLSGKWSPEVEKEVREKVKDIKELWRMYLSGSDPLSWQKSVQAKVGLDELTTGLVKRSLSKKFTEKEYKEFCETIELLMGAERDRVYDNFHKVWLEQKLMSSGEDEKAKILAEKFERDFKMEGCITHEMMNGSRKMGKVNAEKTGKILGESLGEEKGGEFLLAFVENQSRSAWWGVDMEWIQKLFSGLKRAGVNCKLRNDQGKTALRILLEGSRGQSDFKKQMTGDFQKLFEILAEGATSDDLQIKERMKDILSGSLIEEFVTSWLCKEELEKEGGQGAPRMKRKL